MALYEDSLETLAKYLGVTRQTLSQKIDGTAEFKRNEIEKIIVRYELTPEETREIFFS